MFIITLLYLAGSEDRYVYLYDMGELNDTEQDAAT